MALFERSRQRKNGPDQSDATLEQAPTPETGALLALEVREAELNLIGRGQEEAEIILNQLAQRGVKVEAGQADDILPLLRQAYQLRPEVVARASAGEILSEEDRAHLEKYQEFLGGVESATVTVCIDRDYGQAEANLSGPEEPATRKLFERVKGLFFAAIPLLAGLGAAPAFAGDAGGTSRPVELISSGAINAVVITGVAIAGYGVYRHQTLPNNPHRREQNRWFGTGLLGIAIALGGVVGGTTANNLAEVLRRASTSVFHPFYRAADAKAEAFARGEEVKQEQAQTEKERVQARRPLDTLRAVTEGGTDLLRAKQQHEGAQADSIEQLINQPERVKIVSVLGKIEQVEIKLNETATNEKDGVRQQLEQILNNFRIEFGQFQVLKSKERDEKRGEILGLITDMQAGANNLEGNKRRAAVVQKLQEIFALVVYL